MPPLECVKTFWVLAGPSNIAITCALYRTPKGLELRAGHGEQDTLLREAVGNVGRAEKLAATWKTAAETKGFAAWGLSG
jgi:hypothetical protein